ncbi:MAG: hypothetical protein KHW45_09340, partial [Collinsella sp.]|nr:hypothetical protein [Collinsella sp.]
IAPLPVLNPAKGRIFCNYKKMIGQDVNHGLTEPSFLAGVVRVMVAPFLSAIHPICLPIGI